MPALRIVVRLLSVLMIASGTGCLTYGAAVDPAQFHPPLGIEMMHGPAETIGWGIGLLVGGILLLVVFGLRMPQFDKPGRP